MATRPGFIGGGEVVEVEFDPRVIPYDELVRMAQESDCAAPVFACNDKQLEVAHKIVGDQAKRKNGRVRPDKEPKHYLSRTLLRHVPMTALQAVRVNARIRSGDFQSLLSPSQLELLKGIEAKPDAGWPNAIGKDIVAAWRECERIVAKVGGG